MRKDITVAAEARSEYGKNAARRLRARGSIPAVVYGAGADAAPVAVSPKDIDKILYSNTGHNTIFNLEVQGTEQLPVMIVDWQHDPIKGNLLHVDLKRIDLSKRIVVKVPVHAEGEPKGVKQQGGLLEIVAREIEIECVPVDIPEHFVADVRELLIGQSVRAADVPLPASMALKSPPDTVICHVVALRVTEAPAVTEEVPAAAPAAAEPEVIKRGKKEEEEGEGGKKK